MDKGQAVIGIGGKAPCLPPFKAFKKGEALMLCLYIQAPFAVFRTFSAATLRPTADFITYSAAYGLILNVAGIEMRQDSDKEPMTLIRGNLPKFHLAIGALELPETHSVFQQAHNYPVGNTGKEHEPFTKGSKYNIKPMRRVFLSGIKAYLCIRGNDELEQGVINGLSGNNPQRYGLPFLGDNNFFLDRIEPVAALSPARWLIPFDDSQGAGPAGGMTRLTISIDRANMARTKSGLFAPNKIAEQAIPDNAWQEVGY
jgi:CRISPR-associated protein Cas5t